MESLISRDVKLKIILGLSSPTLNLFGTYSHSENLLTFLCKIWDLDSMESQDQRFSNAKQDILHHFIRNDDLSIEELLVKRLQIVDGPQEIFIKFIQEIVHPEIRLTSSEIFEYVSLINDHLSNTSKKLYVVDHFNELPIYELREKGIQIDLPSDIQQNTIPIYKGPYLPDDAKFPNFLVRYNSWNDYGYVNSLRLHYYLEDGHKIEIGLMKIFCKNSAAVYDTLSDEFYSLDESYCSLGQNEAFYFNLKNHVFNYQSVLLALRDVALFPKIHEIFEEESGFANSLIRENEAEKLLRTIKYELQGISLNDKFKFNYAYTPPYSTDIIDLNFDFDLSEGEIPHRIYALIGKNGTGKTQMLTSLAKSLSQKSEKITPHIPIFAKVFTISYSVFDNFEIPKSDASFNYVYCGLKKDDDALYSRNELIEKYKKSLDIILERKRDFSGRWFKIIGNFISQDLLDSTFSTRTDEFGRTKLIINADRVEVFLRKLSSGQMILLYIITEIIANIRSNSLILYDEPETHLHPNAISELINTIYEIVETFDSYCIIATHSPIIIQEIPSRDVYVLDRIEDSIKTRRLEMESFGENLTVITEEIFKNREIAKYHYGLIKKLVNQGMQYDEILNILENDNLPVALKNRLYIKGLINLKSSNETFGEI